VQARNNILINDACTLIDLVELNLHEYFFGLNYVFYSTASVLAEIKDKRQQALINDYVESGKLIINRDGEFTNILEIFDKYTGISFQDASIIEFSIRMQGAVVTSDRRIREITKSMGLIARGMLWIIETLVEDKIIDVPAAIKHLRSYAEINSWAPKKEIENLISRLSEKNESKEHGF
jgi:hypothetical protein